MTTSAFLINILWLNDVGMSFHQYVFKIESDDYNIYVYIPSTSKMHSNCREFGVKAVNIKPLVKKIPSILEDRDKTVRDEGKAMVVEIYRWIGPALNPQLSALKPVQVC